MSFGGSIRIDKRDRVFSLLVRELAGHRCQACGDPAGQVKLECAHVVGRRYRATRWLLDNARCLCHACHRFFTEHPLQWVQFIGMEEYQRLDARAQQIAKFTEHELETIYRSLCSQLARVRGEPEPTFRAPKPRKKAKRASGKRPRASRYKRKVDGSVVLRSA